MDKPASDLHEGYVLKADDKPLAAGEYETKDGQKITVADGGKVTGTAEIVETVTVAEGKLLDKPASDLHVGYVLKDDEGNPLAGEYETKDGKKVAVDGDGKVTESPIEKGVVVTETAGTAVDKLDKAAPDLHEGYVLKGAENQPLAEGEYETTDGKMVTVGSEGKVTGIADVTVTLNKNNLILAAGSKKTLIATTTPGGANVVWSTTDKTIVTVSQSGEVTALKEGTATIAAAAGGQRATCTVTVNAIDVSLREFKYTITKQSYPPSSDGVPFGLIRLLAKDYNKNKTYEYVKMQERQLDVGSYLYRLKGAQTHYLSKGTYQTADGYLLSIDDGRVLLKVSKYSYVNLFSHANGHPYYWDKMRMGNRFGVYALNLDGRGLTDGEKIVGSTFYQKTGEETVDHKHYHHSIYSIAGDKAYYEARDFSGNAYRVRIEKEGVIADILFESKGPNGNLWISAGTAKGRTVLRSIQLGDFVYTETPKGEFQYAAAPSYKLYKSGSKLYADYEIEINTVTHSITQIKKGNNVVNVIYVQD